jgi:hypothetical protein
MQQMCFTGSTYKLLKEIFEPWVAALNQYTFCLS